MASSVLCLVDSRDRANDIVSQLQSAGFSNNDISVLFPDKSGTRDFAHEKHTKAPEGTAAGAVTGGMVGGALGLLAGLGLLAIPGVGPFIAAGPIMATLGGMGVGGSVGSLVGALIGMGLPEIEAKRYEGKIKSGNILISAHSDNWDKTRRAKEIYESCGATDISTASEKSAPETKSTESSSRYST